MRRGPILALRALLLLLICGGLLAQLWYFPVLASQLAEREPELAWLRWPLLAAVILGILTAQLAVVAVWQLLSMVSNDAVFTPAAYTWANLIIAASAFEAVLVFSLDVFLSFFVHANPPALMLFLLALTVCATAFALLVAVMKGLLRKASALQDELSEVI
jgi:hypothetical protein